MENHMNLSCTPDLDKRPPADVLIVPFWQNKKKAEPARSVTSLQAVLDPPLQTHDFLAKEGETLMLYASKGKEKRLLLVGLGSKKDCTAEVIRRSYAAALRCALKKKLSRLNVAVPKESEHLATALCEGLFLANYKFDRLKGESSEKDPLVSKVCLIGVDKKKLKECSWVLTLISSVHFTRDLVNGNADDVTAQTFCALARQLAKEASLKATILDKKQLEKEKMGLHLAVNQGANQDPALIILEYRGNPGSKDVTAILGKGITYDTGGLNIKQTGQMETMKCDMAGAASVFGTLKACADLKIRQNVIGVIAAAENAVGPKSYKPGDVYRSKSGKTVEISNTDAEGRLVLADALTYTLEKLAPTRIIDLATLTGGIVVALGEEVTGLFSNDDRLAEAIFKAGEVTQERVWRFPLYPEYKDVLKSSIADLKNSGGRKASSISAAIFLQQFIKDIPWAHLDIAGTAFLSELKMPYHPSYATGVGVRLLIEFLQHNASGNAPR